MTRTVDYRLVELLNARLCHDLISPVAATCNGVELITQFEDEMQGEAMALIAESAGTASRHLQFYRLALGSARGMDGTAVALAEARRRALDCLAGGPRIKVDWPERSLADGVPRIGLKLLLNMALAATDILGGQGTAAVDMRSDGAAARLTVRAVRDGLVLTDSLRGALDGSAAMDDLTPRTVVARHCLVLADMAGGKLTFSEHPGAVELNAAIPATARQPGGVTAG